MIDLVALEAAVRKNRPMEIAGLFEHATEAERKESRALLRTLEAEEREWWNNWQPGRLARGNPLQRRPLDAFRLATTPSAEGAARILRESQFGGEHWTEQAPIILARTVRWKPKLLDLLTTAVRDSSTARSETPWHVVEPLLEQAGLTHLDTPGYALEMLRRQSGLLDADAQLAVDPALPGLLLRAIESDRLDDADIEDWRRPAGERGEDRWAKIAAHWARAGHLDRHELHRALARALVRGGAQPHLRALLTFLDELSPTPDEIRSLQREYLALIEADFSAVASHALKALRAADTDQPLETAAVVDACERALTRPEAATGTAALAWLKALLRRDPSSSPEIRQAAEIGLTHPKRAVQVKAAELAGTAPVEAAVETGPRLPDRPPLPPCPPFVVPDSLDELLHVLRRPYQFADEERSIYGFARFAGEMDDAQRAEVMDRGQAFRVWEALSRGFRRPGLLDGLRDRMKATKPIVDLIAARAGEVGAAAGRSGVTMLSVPRDLSGLVDPEALLDGLQRLRREQATALPLDLEAAWLRLPLAAQDGDFAARVERVGGRDASWLAAQVRRGPVPSPNLGITERPRSYGEPVARAVGLWPEAAGRGGALLARISELAAGLSSTSNGHEPSAEVALTPTQRDLIAAECLLDVDASFDAGYVVEHLGLLPHQEGRLGPPSHTLLALAANAEKATLRAAVLDGTLGLLATNALDGAGAGQAWAFLHRRPDIKLGRWTTHLSDVAQSSVAGSRYAWEVLRQMLDAGLPDELSRRSGAADLVALAADAALTVGAKGTVAGLAEIAERPGKSRIVLEAKRLHQALTS